MAKPPSSRSQADAPDFTRDARRLLPAKRPVLVESTCLRPKAMMTCRSANRAVVPRFYDAVVMIYSSSTRPAKPDEKAGQLGRRPRVQFSSPAGATLLCAV